MPSRNMSSSGDYWDNRTILELSKSDFEVDSTSHNKESTILQYHMYITMRLKCSGLCVKIEPLKA